MTTTASPLAPNPQFRRDSWIDLCGTWGFAHDDANQGIKQAWWNKRDAFNRQIVVPFPPKASSRASAKPASTR
ncbi:hypothetical protein [Devosia aurantiaca]|uniref:hypothetical protein n=1 Tax=Devosia aurantiaca TaxID=2714858 RepID=UPI001A988873|nr:hypothetical protein [Devosia aurantiaca]